MAIGTMKIWQWIQYTLSQFIIEFSRESSFSWFVIVIIGMMIRTDQSGITGIVRDLFMNPSVYPSLIHFFHADSWNIKSITKKWMQIVANSGCLFKEAEHTILVGDGVSQHKEGRKTPGVKKIHQESENSSKSEFIYGHYYGVLGVVAGSLEKLFCVPITASIQNGVDIIRTWADETHEAVSHVVQVVKDGCEATKIYGKSVLLLDRYFLTVPVLQALEEYEKKTRQRLLSIVTRAKSNIKAYRKPQPKTGRGRPPKKGEAVKLDTLFSDLSCFKEATVLWYGKEKKILYYCIDLLWGKKLYKELRFVLVSCDGVKSILVTNDLAFTPEQVIRLYGYRFKIEVTFKATKQVIRGFFSHFWSKEMPRLNRYRKKTEKDPLEDIKDKQARDTIVKSLKAIEGHALFGCISTGLLQLISLLFTRKTNGNLFRWLRTKTNSFHSEATVADFLRRNLFVLFKSNTIFSLSRFIRNKIFVFSYSDDLSA